MFVIKKKYFLIIESIKDINLERINKYNKFVIIYRNQKKIENRLDLVKFCKSCKIKKIEFIIANNLTLAIDLKADGIYLSSYNKSFNHLHKKNKNFKIIGSAHNIREINEKIKQGCEHILLSRLFFVNYKSKSDFLGINKFNKYASRFNGKLVPLGGIKINNLNKLNSVKSKCFAILSEIKKKPAIISRLF